MVQGKIRLKFQKTGKLRFISHLDLVRTMKSAFVRAGIPIYYSEGFNPHPKMVFSLPLSLGCESFYEFMDIKLNSPMKKETLLKLLNDSFTSDLRFLEVYTPTTDFNDIGASLYEIRILDDIDLTKLKDAFKKPLVVTKKSKKGMIDVDLQPNVKNCRIVKTGKEINIKCLLSAKPDSYVNPEHLIKALSEAVGGIFDYYITRLTVYHQNGEEFR